MFIINHRKIFYFVAVALVLASIVSLAVWGLKPGIDFAGGSFIKISYIGSAPSVEQIRSQISQDGFGEASVRTGAAAEQEYSIRLRELKPDEKTTLMSSLTFGGKYTPVEKEFSSVGPVLGAETLRKSYFAIFSVLIGIVLFITFAFRKVSRPVSSWVYGFIAIIALAHDVIVPVGLYSFLGHFYGIEVDALFVTALLVILGFSVHDTIVVFDRVRENLHHASEKERFDYVVGKSISETFVRSINTSLTTVLAILALYIWGPETTRHFSLVLLVGIVAGTYSSIFIGSPLLVTINNWRKK